MAQKEYHCVIEGVWSVLYNNYELLAMSSCVERLITYE